MSQLPSFQFYPGDWRRDPAVQSLSLPDRAVWMEIICLIHDSPERGVLLLPNGRPMTEIELSRNLGLSPAQTKRAVASILDSGTGSRRNDGAIYNRRMVRDEHIRQVRKVCGSLGGNPDLVKQNTTKEVNQSINQTPTPSSSSSSSKKRLLRFAEFWEVYPKKRGKGAAEKSWSKQSLDEIADMVLAAVRTQRVCRDWQKDNGQFIPYPATWLNEKRWQDSPDVPPTTERRLVL